MMDMDPVAILAIVTSVVAAASVIVKGLAMLTKITPTTRDDELIGKAQKGVAYVQRVLGTISMDSSKQAKR